MATNGLYTASCAENGALAVGRVPESSGSFDEENVQFAAHIRDQDGRDFQPVPVIAYVGGHTPPAAVSLQEFRRSFIPPVPVYRCPKCGGNAVVRSQEDIRDFEAHGGTLLLVGVVLS